MTDELVRSLLLVADDLDDRGYPKTGVIRRAAHQLADGGQPQPDGDHCERCGAAFTPPTTGRPRSYCYTCSPRKSSGKV